MYRQGDVLLIKINELPKDVKFKTRKDKIILKGEVTGHAHRFKGNTKILEVAERISTLDYSAQRVIDPSESQVIGYAIVDKPAQLTHEEHNTITIPAGIYEIRRQREYDENHIRFVTD